jgi:hypothetical protein
MVVIAHLAEGMDGEAKLRANLPERLHPHKPIGFVVEDAGFAITPAGDVVQRAGVF